MSAIIKEERIGGQRLLLGDCLKIMPELGRFDAVVTDPPYGVLSEDWDDMSRRELYALTMDWVSSAYRTSDTLLTFFGQKTRDVPNLILPQIFESVRQIIWNKSGGVQASDNMFYAYESAYLCRKKTLVVDIVSSKSMGFASALTMCRKSAGLSKGAIDIAVRGKKTGLCYRWEEGCFLPSDEQVSILNDCLLLTTDFHDKLAEARIDRDKNIAANRQRTADAAAHHLDVLSYSPDTKNSHPSPKPVPLMMDLIRILGTNTNLDPFMGSGTTLVACQRLGRSGTGIELDPDYFDIACKRVDEASRQVDLFIEPPKQSAPVQENLLDGDTA